MGGIVDVEAMRARLAELDAEREPLLALIRAAETYEGVVGRTLFSSAGVTVRHGGRVPSESGRAAPVMAATESAVSEALNALGPLGTSDLASLLADKPEVSLPRERAINVLSARLSNSTKFVSTRGVGWWFADQPLPKDPASSIGQRIAEATKEIAGFLT